MPTAQAYANLHRKFLANNHPKLLMQLEEEGTLSDYLQSVGESALEMYDDMSARMMTAKTLPTDYMARVKALEAIPHAVEECVLHDLIYQPNNCSE